MFNGIWMFSGVVSAVMLFIMPMIIALLNVQQYNLLTAMPISMEKVPAQMYLMNDVIYIIIVPIDMAVLIAVGIYEGALLRLTVDLIFYLIANVVLYVMVRSASQTYGTVGKVISFISGFFVGGIISSLGIMPSIIIHGGFEDIEGRYGVLICAAAIAAVFAVIARVLSKRGVRNCMRQIKIYRSSAKKKAVREEQYV